MDKNLGAQRKARWNKAFNSSNLSDSGVELFDEPSGEFGEEQVAERNVNRKATIVLEHLIQASDVSHTMQHWHVYSKFEFFHHLVCVARLALTPGRCLITDCLPARPSKCSEMEREIIP
jgi:hypothetical protein